MNRPRMLVLQQIYTRLASLEEQRETARLAEQDCSAIDSEMKALRLKLQEVNSNPCPVLQGGN